MTLYYRYPVLADPGLFVERELGYRLPLSKVFTEQEILEAARAYLEAALQGRDPPEPRSEWEAVLGFHASLAVVGASKSLRLSRVFNDYYESVFAERLRGEDLQTLFRIARALSLNLERASLEIPWAVTQRGRLVPKILVASLPLHEYLGLAVRLEGPLWRLSNSFLLHGRVYLDRQRLDGLLAAAMRARMEELEAGYSEDFSGVEQLAAEAEKARARLEAPARPGFSEAAMPDCVKALLSRLAGGEELSPIEFYTLATFLANTGAPPEILADALHAGGWASRPVAEVMARVVLEEAAGYRPPKCRVLREAGVCECEDDLLASYFRRRAGSRGRGKGRG